MKRPEGTHPVYWRSLRCFPPKEWPRMPIGHMAAVTKGKLPKTLFSRPTENSVPYLLIDGLNEGESLYTEDNDLPMIEPGDTVVVADGSRSGLPIRGITGALGSTLLQYRVKNGIDPDYFYYLLESLYAFTNTATIGGAVPHLDKRLLSKLVLAVPEQPEMSLIGEVLCTVDNTISSIKDHILAAERLKTALMQQLFTKGIPGRHKRFKKTKIGEFPAEWDILRGRQCFRIVGSYSPPPPDSGPDGDCHYLKVSDFNLEGNEKVLTTAQTRFFRKNNLNAQLYRPGLIVFAKRGEALRKNRVRLLGAYSMIDPNLMLLEAIEKVTTERYLYHYLTHYRLARFCEDAGIPQLNNKDLYPRLFPMPQREEQEEIVNILEAADAWIEAVMQKLKAVQRLKKSLLQNLLTGKVRVNMEANV